MNTATTTILKLAFWATSILLAAEIIDDQNIFTFPGIQRNNGVPDNPGCQQGSKTDPVDLEHLHKAVNGVFRETWGVTPGNQAHIHAPVRENQQEKILENLNNRNSLFLIGIGRF